LEWGIMRKYILSIILLIFYSVNSYSQYKDVYSLINIIPDKENEGLNYFYNYTGIKDNINIIKSGWIDLVGDNRNTEFYIKYYIEETKRYNIIVLSKRTVDILYYKSWEASNEQYNITFFRRNNEPYMIVDYRGGSGNYYVFSVLKYKYMGSFFTFFDIIYEKELGFGGWFELIGGKIICYKDDNKKYFLNYNNGIYELIEENKK
jgi:hypothetical protein